MTKTLSGKVALVTGGSRGIGAAIARELSDQGADVAISYASSADKAAANAGVFHYGLVTTDDHEEALDDVYAVNSDAVLTGIREAGRVMGEGGRIISISSGVSTRTGAPGLADYAASKAAVDGFTRGAARDLGPKGITVNVIGTGPVNTDMNPEDGPISDWLKNESALGRYARVEEISAAVAFLASPRASYITGSVMAVDGGYAA